MFNPGMLGSVGCVGSCGCSPASSSASRTLYLTWSTFLMWSFSSASPHSILSIGAWSASPVIFARSSRALSTVLRLAWSSTSGSLAITASNALSVSVITVLVSFFRSCLTASIMSHKQDDKVAYEYLLKIADKYLVCLNDEQRQALQEIKFNATSFLKSSEPTDGAKKKCER